MTGSELSRLSEPEARTMLEQIRWPEGPICPHCDSDNAAKLGGAAGSKGQHKCRACRKKFTVRVGTIMEDSPIPLSDWVYAFHRMCASKKGISAHQLHRELGITYKSAWFMCHRIRLAMTPSGEVKLSGTVEVDETYVGGKPRKQNLPTPEVSDDKEVQAAPPKTHHKRGRGTSKQPVLALVEREGRVKSRVICNITAATLKGAIREHVERDSTIMTDELASYAGIGNNFEGGHRTVTHSAGQYANPDGTNTNTVESYFALLKRGMYGTFHHVSVKHLQRYCNEFNFRWDWRRSDDVTRTVAALRGAAGKRLMYREAATHDSLQG